MLKSIIIVLVMTAVGSAAYAMPCEPIVQTKCTQVQISAENCHDGGPYDSRGPYYGPLTLPDGTVSCDAWHGYTAEENWIAATTSNGWTVANPPPHTAVSKSSAECVCFGASGGFMCGCVVNFDLGFFGRYHASCSVTVEDIGSDAGPHGHGGCDYYEGEDHLR